jgi:site-specific recombinase XerD
MGGEAVLMKPLRQKLVDTLTLRGYSPRTIESYVKTVETLAKAYWRSPEKISDEEITAFLLRGLRESQWSASTLNVKVNGLRFFYRHVLGRSLEAVQKALPHCKRAKRMPRVYSREELELLFTKGCRTQKERVFLMVVYGGGLRLGEACRLKVGDIESKRMRIRVNQGKGKKDRYTLLGERLLEELRVYYRWFHPGEYLFGSSVDPEKPWSDRAGQRVFWRALERAGLPNRGGIHSLRHSFATHLLEAGVEITVIRVLLGHNSLAATSIYLHVADTRFGTLRSPLDTFAPAPCATTEGR